MQKAAHLFIKLDAQHWMPLVVDWHSLYHTIAKRCHTILKPYSVFLSCVICLQLWIQLVRGSGRPTRHEQGLSSSFERYMQPGAVRLNTFLLHNPTHSCCLLFSAAMDSTGKRFWQTNTSGTGPFILIVTDTGNLVLYDSTKTCLWSAKGNCAARKKRNRNRN